jgi:uncharacterized RmlC-like cupin family protein
VTDRAEKSAPAGFSVVREGAPFRGKQGHIYRPAVSAEGVGSRAIHMQLLEIPPGERAKAHKHAAHETAIHVLAGVSGCFWGDKLEHHAIAGAGDFVYIAADVPHLPYNRSDSEAVIAVIARTDPNEQESVILMPELEAGVDWSLAK